MKQVRLEQGFYVLLAAAIVFLGLSWWGARYVRVPVNTEPCQLLNANWTYRLSDGETGQLTLPSHIDALRDTPFYISRQLTAEDLAKGTTLRLRSSQQTLRVLLDGQEIYRFGQERPLAFLHSPGCAYHFIRLDEAAVGKTLTLEFSSSYATFSGYLNEAAAGTKNALVFEIIQRDWAKVLICGAIGLIGLGLIISHAFFRRRRVQITNGALYLGLATIGIAIWSLTETRLVEFLLPIPTVIYLLTFLSLLLIPYPVLLFLRANFSGLSEKTYHLLGLLLGAVVVVSLTLQLTGTADLMETIFLSHLAIAVVCVVLVVVILKDCRQRRQLTLLAKGLLVLMACVIIDLLRFYDGGLYDDSAAAMRVGMLIFTALLGYDAIMRMYHLMEQAVENKALERLAYVDALTACSNRTAFELMMNELAEHPECYPAVELVMFDLNDFKHINDDFGHQAGDTVLIQAVCALEQSFESCGKCYRIGGDEFMIIALEGIDRFEQRLAQLDQQLHGEAVPYKIDLSCGRAGFIADQSQNIWTIYRLADQRMYEQKQQAKKAARSITPDDKGDDRDGQTDEMQTGGIFS